MVDPAYGFEPGVFGFVIEAEMNRPSNKGKVVCVVWSVVDTGGARGTFLTENEFLLAKNGGTTFR